MGLNMISTLDTWYFVFDKVAVKNENENENENENKNKNENKKVLKCL